ncbi:uncharacterized protein LOC144425207 [Styela clava]
MTVTPQTLQKLVKETANDPVLAEYGKTNKLPPEYKKHFCRHGIPLIVMSDSGSQFKSSQFKEFANKWDFQLATSSPSHQQCNGKAESAVKIAKTMLKKCKLDGSDPNLALLKWRNIPLEHINASPAQ